MCEFRYYRSSLPTEDEYVMGKVGEKNEYGYEIELVEYKDVSCLLTLVQIYKRRARKKNPLKSGDIIPLLVLSVDKDKRAVDLSKKRVNVDDVEEVEKRFRSAEKLVKLGIEIFKLQSKFSDTPLTYEDVMEETIWRLQDDEDDFEKLFEEILKNPSILFTESFEDREFVDKYVVNLKKRLRFSDTVIESNITVHSFIENGVDEIKKSLSVEKPQNKKYRFRINVISPPIYCIHVEGPDESEAKKIIELTRDTIQKRCVDNNLIFGITDDTKVIVPTKVDVKFLSKKDFNRIKF